MRPRTARSLLALVILGAAGTACGDDATTAERFCGEIVTHREELVAPVIATPADVDALVDLYRAIGDVAPLAIEPDWGQLVVNYETASTVVPDDEESVQRAVRVALESERAAANVSRWVEANCGISMGPVATLVAHP